MPSRYRVDGRKLRKIEPKIMRGRNSEDNHDRRHMPRDGHVSVNYQSLHSCCPVFWLCCATVTARLRPFITRGKVRWAQKLKRIRLGKNSQKLFSKTIDDDTYSRTAFSLQASPVSHLEAHILKRKVGQKHFFVIFPTFNWGCPNFPEQLPTQVDVFV